MAFHSVALIPPLTYLYPYIPVSPSEYWSLSYYSTLLPSFYLNYFHFRSFQKKMWLFSSSSSFSFLYLLPPPVLVFPLAFGWKVWGISEFCSCMPVSKSSKGLETWYPWTVFLRSHADKCPLTHWQNKDVQWCLTIIYFKKIFYGWSHVL